MKGELLGSYPTPSRRRGERAAPQGLRIVPSNRNRPGPPMSSSWRLEVLRKPVLVCEDEARSVGAIALIAVDVLLFAVPLFSGRVSRERLQVMLWPEASSARAANSLRQRIHRLRRDTGARLLEIGPVVECAVDLKPLTLPTRAQLEADPAAWDGELLSGVALPHSEGASEWLAQTRADWSRRRAEMLDEIAAEAEHRSDLGRALAFAQRRAQLHPLEEAAQRRVMRLHYLRDDRASAIATFERFERFLKDELGARPSATTIELLRTVETSAPRRRLTAGNELPLSLVRPPIVIGRDALIQRMELAWGQRRALLLTGEPGSGKSRLVHEFLQTAGAVSLASARPDDLGIPLETLRRLLRVIIERFGAAASGPVRAELARLLPELGSVTSHADPAAGDAALRVALRELLFGAMGVGLNGVALDDLHFADDATIALLPWLLRECGEVGPRWVLASRPTDERAQRLYRTLLEVAAVEPIDVGPLDEAQVEELLRTLDLPSMNPAATARRLLPHTGGNPLFVLETLRQLVSSSGEGEHALPRPESIAQLIERRLLDLTPPALHLARLAAVAGSDFTAAMAEELLQLPPLLLADPWRELERAQVFNGTQFAHDLVFDATQRTIPAVIRSRAHLQVAGFMERAGGDPAPVARHWELGGEWTRAAQAYLTTADRALARSRRDDEHHFLTQAMRCFDAADQPNEAFAARLRRLSAALVTQAGPPVVEEADELQGLAHTIEQRLDAALLAHRARMNLGKVLEALEPIAVARSLLEGEAPSESLDRRRASLARAQAQTLAQLGRVSEAGDALLAEEAWHLEKADDVERAEFLHANGFVRYAEGKYRLAIDALSQARDVRMQRGDLTEALVSATNLVIAQTSLGLSDAAIVTARECERLTAQLGLAMQQRTVNAVNLGIACAGAGHYVQAITALEPVAAAGPSGGVWSLMASMYLAAVWLRIGQPARAYPALDQSLEGIALPPIVPAVQALFRVERTDAEGTTDRALVEQAAATARASGHRTIIALLDTHPLKSDDDAEAQATAARLLDEAIAADWPVVAAIAATAQACRPDSAASAPLRLDRLSRALELLRNVELATAYKPRLLLAISRRLETEGQGVLAAQTAHEARAWIRARTLPELADMFRAGFLQRSPTHAALFAKTATQSEVG